MVLWTALAWFGVAWAGPASYLTCCDALGASADACPLMLPMSGPGSRSQPGAVQGVWTLRCDAGPQFDPGNLLPARNAAEGDILVTLDPRAAQCFQAACALPAGLCLRYDGRSHRLADCQTNAPPTALTLTTPARAGGTVVVVAGRALSAQAGVHAEAAPSVRSSQLPAATVPPPAPAAPLSVVVNTPTPSAAAPTAAVSRVVPAPPTGRCTTADALRSASDEQLSLGNEAEIAGSGAQALDHYRAAISLHPCNAFAWAALGNGLLQVEAPSEARQALQTAVGLMPDHYRAWANLGAAAEATGDQATARNAYQRAVSLRPNHAPAVAGLDRLGGR